MAISYKLRKLISILKVKSWRKALITHGVAASCEHSRALKMIRKLNTIIDVGANRGQFALAARNFFPSAKIYSFEPLSKPAQKYRQILGCDGLTHLNETAIGLENGRVEIHISARDDSSSLLPIGPSQSTLFPGTQEIGTEIINISSLSNCINENCIVSPALLKIDVQGFELAVLRGSENLLGRFDWIYIECSFIELYVGQALADSVIAWLRERGYNLTGVYNMTYDRYGRAVQADFIFSRRVRSE